ncbi:hypothetical protein SAMN04488527_1167 [Aliiroseovarius crassostreae]|uniref:AB hydrolase-1 domain-containing protein n=1 Tax=Aliiroseovarius crassostreae TaxID=154981 RepID=A0A0P7J0X9_9RHOB|nr:hypothetical protein [Aliiroseovarius crassostreae]KPN64816.1 hypothetical protein AKJ29_06165 [Aliiroseovarius crassostreae]SFU77791.1 hypothetical protein SAMN04488527_1167 [Aliiroseovarius crassostreae]
MRSGLRKSLRQVLFRLKSRTLYQDAELEMRALEGRGDGAMIVFTSYHNNVAKRGLLEFAASASQQGLRHCLFITDRTQGWFQGEKKSATIIRVVADYLTRNRIAKTMTVGVSMGGYGALSYARDLGAGRALAFAPQYCPRPDRFPSDQRWLAARRRIAHFSRPSLDSSMRGGPQFTLLHGRRNREDMLHWQSFSQGSHIDHYLADIETHDVIDPLRNAGILYPVIDSVWNDDTQTTNTLLKKIHAVRRLPQETASAATTEQPGPSAPRPCHH